MLHDTATPSTGHTTYQTPAGRAVQAIQVNWYQYGLYKQSPDMSYMFAVKIIKYLIYFTAALFKIPFV